MKHVYLDITPSKAHKIRLGLQSFNDAHSLVFDNDWAGIKYDVSFDKLSLGLGYFVTEDAGEENLDDVLIVHR